MQFEVTGSDGRPVRAVQHGHQDAPAILFAHGFKGFRGWGSFPWICERLAEAGLRTIRFDFSHNGVEETDFDRLDLFMLDTPTRHQQDLHALAKHIPGPLGLLGHSRGGGDVILFGAAEPRVKAVATLASIARLMPATLPEMIEFVETELGPAGRVWLVAPIDGYPNDPFFDHIPFIRKHGYAMLITIQL